MNFLKWLLSGLLLFAFQIVFSQYSVGTMKISFSFMKINGKEVPESTSKIMNDMNITIYSDGMIQKSEVIMINMKMINIRDFRKDSTYNYIDFKDKKYKIAQFINDTALANQTAFEVKEFPSDVKQILGFNCHRVEVVTKTPAVGSSKITLYVTNELNFNGSYINQFSQQTPAFKGTPLEFTVSNTLNNNMTTEMTMRVTHYSKDVNPIDLLVPTGHYENATMEELVKLNFLK